MRAVYDRNRAKCACGFLDAFGVATNANGTWYLRTSQRWGWDVDRFRHGKPARGIPSAARRGPAELAAPAGTSVRRGRWDGDVELMVPLPQSFVCRRCGETSLVDQP
jgi:hypothetical protein